MAKQNEEYEYEESSGNVFADLGLDHPEDLLARAKLLDAVSSLIQNSGLSQLEVAKKLGLTQPKISMLVNGKLSAFSTDTLMQYLVLLGCEVQITIKKPQSKNKIFNSKGYIAVL